MKTCTFCYIASDEALNDIKFKPQRNEIVIFIAEFTIHSLTKQKKTTKNLIKDVHNFIHNISEHLSINGKNKLTPLTLNSLSLKLQYVSRENTFRE